MTESRRLSFANGYSSASENDNACCAGIQFRADFGGLLLIYFGQERSVYRLFVRDIAELYQDCRFLPADKQLSGKRVQTKVLV